MARLGTIRHDWAGLGRGLMDFVDTVDLVDGRDEVILIRQGFRLRRGYGGRDGGQVGG
jgi:hypothetical protein